jgi:hypothetical protein
MFQLVLGGFPFLQTLYWKMVFETLRSLVALMCHSPSVSTSLVQARNALSQLLEDADRDVAAAAKLAYGLVVREQEGGAEEDGSSDQGG